MTFQGLANEYTVVGNVVYIWAFDGAGRRHVVSIDGADLELVKAQNTQWCVDKNGHVARQDIIAGKPRYLHQVVIGVRSTRRLHIDHRDRDKLNNRRSNLRSATASLNALNHGMNPRNRSGFPGVVWRKQRRCWRVQVRIDGKTASKEFRDYVKACEHARNLYVTAGVPADKLPAVPASEPSALGTQRYSSL